MNFNRNGGRYGRICLAGMLLLVMGCAGKKRELPLVSITEKAPFQVCTIAVLPIGNQTKYTAAGLMFYRVLLAEMAKSADFHVIEEGMIRRVLLRGKVYPGQSLAPEIRGMIFKATHADALVSGEVVSAEEEKDRVHLAFNLRVRDARTGHLLWTTYYARSGDDYRKALHFGEIDTLTGLARQMVHDVLKSWHEKGLGGCN